MSKNLEDLLYRGDSLDKMGQMSSDLRESSKKYKRAAVRINWELLLKQVRLDSIYFQVEDLKLMFLNSTVLSLVLDLSSSSSSSGVSGRGSLSQSTIQFIAELAHVIELASLHQSKSWTGITRS